MWLRSLGVAAGFLGAHTVGLQTGRKTLVVPPLADVGRAALNSSCATRQVIRLPACCDVTSSCNRRLARSVGGQRRML